jgi:hypothetical protein
MNEPTNTTATFDEWHRALCAVARERGGSASTRSPWMRRQYDRGHTPAEAWENFENDEV